MVTDPTRGEGAMLPFLAAYFSEPLEEAHLLVLADWLEEQDRPLTAALIRQALAGHAADDRRDWASKMADLALAFRRQLGGRVRLQGEDSFTLRGSSRRFRVRPGGIEAEQADRCWAPVPEEAGTGRLMEAALFVLLLRLATSGR